MAHNCRNERNIEENKKSEIERLEYQLSSNKFKVLTSKMIKIGIFDKEKEKKKEKLREVIVNIKITKQSLQSYI